MLRGTTRREDRQAEQSTGGGSLLGRLIPFAIAFVAGFLFGRRRGGGSDSGGGGDGGSGGSGGGGGGRLPRLTSIAPGIGGGEETASEEVEGRVPERVEDVVPEAVEEAAPEAATPGEQAGGAESEAQGAETTGQPSSMGSVAGEEARRDEREGEAEDEEAGEGAEGEQAGKAAEGDESAEIDDEVRAVEAPMTHGMPMFGLGTYRMEDYDGCVEAVRTAIEMGYRHIDTAEGYGNEDAVGDAIAEVDVDREDLFVATKVSPDNLDYDQVLTSAEESLDRLGVEYVDLLYVHWPTGDYEATDTLDAFAELRREGIIEEIGVSNFEPEQLAEAVEVADEPVFADQVEMHPLLQQTELQSFCAQDDVDVELVAYSPIARGEVDDVDELQEIAEKHDATPAQVSLAWLREKGVTAIPKASSRDHLRENWLSLAVELDDEDVARIDDIEQEERVVDPDYAPWNE